MNDYNTMMVMVAVPPSEFNHTDNNIELRSARHQGMLSPPPLTLLEREYNKTTNPGLINNNTHWSDLKSHSTTQEASSGEPISCPPHCWPGYRYKETRLQQGPVEVSRLDPHVDLIYETTKNGLDEPSDCSNISQHLSLCQSRHLYSPSQPSNDLVLQSLHQIWSRATSSSSQQSTPCHDEQDDQGLRLDEVLHMIDSTISSTSTTDGSSLEDFILLTLTSYPFRILYAPPALKSMLQSSLVGEPLYKHLSPSSVLPTMSLVDASSSPLPTVSIPCLLDDVFECHAEALPVLDSGELGTMFYAVFVHEVHKPIDTIFPSDG
jgi:hypothetical protein